jgi:hypothetical protein
MFKEKEQFRNVLIQNDLIYATCKSVWNFLLIIKVKKQNFQAFK